MTYVVSQLSALLVKEEREGGKEGNSTDNDYGREKKKLKKKTLQKPLRWVKLPIFRVRRQ